MLRIVGRLNVDRTKKFKWGKIMGCVETWWNSKEPGAGNKITGLCGFVGNGIFPKCLKAFNSQRDLDGIMEQQRTRLKPFFDNTDRVKTH